MRHSSEQPRSPCGARQMDTEHRESIVTRWLGPSRLCYDYMVAPRLVPQEGNPLGGDSHETTGLPLKLAGDTF